MSRGGIPDFPEPVRIISDLHLAHPSSRAGEVGGLRPLVAGAGTVIFNGDTCEQSCRDWRSAGQEKLGELRALCEEEGAEACFLAGNHDPEISERGWLDLVAGRVFLTHGHAMCLGGTPWSHEYLHRREEILQLVREREREGVDLAYHWETARLLTEALRPAAARKQGGNYVLSALWPPARFLSILQSWRGIADTASAFVERFRPAAGVVFFGHFHRPGLWYRGGRVICNTGAFMRGSRPLMGELAGGWLSIRTVSRDHDEFRPGERRALFEI